MSEKLLFLTQSFPPRPAVAARRLEWLADRAVEAGHKVTVIRGDRSYTGEEWKGGTVIAIPLADARSVVGGDGPAGTINFNSWKRRLTPIRESFPFLLFADDGGPAYRRQAFDIARDLIEAGEVDTVFSTFRPWSDHLVAAKLKKAFPRLRWIADFRDLPVDEARDDLWWPGLQKYWGRGVVKRADELWITSSGHAERISAWNDTVRVVRNPLLHLPAERTAPQSKRFTITYTGGLYPDLQTVAPLVNALRQLIASGKVDAEKLSLVYRGKDPGLFRYWCNGLPTRCLDIGKSILPGAAQKLQHDAQLLLSLTWSEPGYYGHISAKLMDYLATGRPIVALINGPIDPELLDLVDGHAAGRVFGNENMEEIHGWVLNLYRSWEAGKGCLPWSVDREKLISFMANPWSVGETENIKF